MFFSLLQIYYSKRPFFLGKLFKLLFSGKRLKIGNNFQCETFPKLLMDRNARLTIGNNVTLRRNVEIRVHQQASIEILDGCKIDRGVRLLATNKAVITLENRVRIGLYSVFNGGDSIKVKEKTLISGFVYLQTSMHNYKEQGDIQNQGYSHSSIELGRDNWIGTHAVIFPGVILGDRCIVGSSSVVNKSFEENSIIAGIPGVLIKKRLNEE